MTPADVRNRREGLGMSEAQFAAALGVSARAVRFWQTGERSPSKAVVILMAKLRKPVKPRGRKRNESV